MFEEFKKFALKGNMIDMAVGIIIGAAFTKLVSSLVQDIIMPPIGMLLGKVDFSNLSFILQEQTATSAQVAVKYGQFINTCIDFFIMAFTIFIVIRQMNRLSGKQKKADKPLLQACPKCYSENHPKATCCAYCTSDI